jgi:hypothetical protein
MDPFFRLTDTYCAQGADVLYEKEATTLKVLGEKSSHASIFLMESALCHLLSLKFTLGEKTYAAYHSTNKDDLKAVIGLYEQSIKAMEAFYQADRKLWYEENKETGFEIHAYRLGGAKQRLIDCRALLADYRAGKIDKIEELEAETKDFNCLEEADRMDTLYLNSWMLPASPNDFGY